MKEVNGYNPSKDPRLINCKTECGNERCDAKRFGLFAERTCPYFTEPKLQTRADRIRAMTDEELAEFLNKGCDVIAPSENCTKAFYDCKRCWLGWLKQEVET